MALREWKLNLRLDIKRGAHTAVYMQIAHAFITEIRRGRLIPGSVLPGSREMAEELGVNRKTIINVYEELVAQGWLSSAGSRGTFVSSTLPVSASKPITRRLASEGLRAEGPQFTRMTQAHTLPVVYPRTGILCLDDGTPDTRIFPAEHFARAYRSAMLVAARGGKLTYGDPRGSPILRLAVAKMLNVDRGLAATPDKICVTRGSQMAIFITARSMIRPGDAVAVEELTYPPAREAFRAAGANIVQIKMDEDGIDMRELELACRREPVRMIYTTPHHHFPTTRLLRPDRRMRLLALAEQFGFFVVEDDYDHEFHFQHQPLLPLASVDPSKVIYIGSMSKLLCPSLRIGYISAPERVIERVAREVVLIDRQGDQVTENAAAELIEAGEVRRHARKAVGIYAQRREKLAVLLRTQIGDVIDFRLPDGGLAFWLTFNDLEDLDRLEERAKEVALTFLPSRCFSGRDDGPRGIRIGFAGLNDAEMHEAVRRLKAALTR
ncbi:MAG: PLP-dependent aminotransferase family protein [Janthinobacterium lividum]